MCGMKPCSACERARAAKINGTMKLPKSQSKVNFAHLGGMLLGYKAAVVATQKMKDAAIKKDPTKTGLLSGMTGGLLKTALGIGIGMYTKPGTLLNGVGMGVAMNGGVQLAGELGVAMSVAGLQGGRLGLGADARYNRLNSQIAGNGNLREMGEQRQKVYAKVA